MDLVRGMIAHDKRMREEHVSFVLKEVIKVSQVADNAMINVSLHDIAEMSVRET